MGYTLQDAEILGQLELSNLKYSDKETSFLKTIYDFKKTDAQLVKKILRLEIEHILSVNPNYKYIDAEPLVMENDTATYKLNFEIIK